MNEAKWTLRTQDETFGPTTEEQLVTWAKLGRIQPGQEISDDGIIWKRVEDVPFLDMRFSIDIGDGNPRGPFNKDAAEALLASGRLPSTATIVESREPFEEEVVESVENVEKVEKVGEMTAVAEPEVKVVEKIVEVPVEKIVEKIVEKEVPVEKIVEIPVEKIIVDETRVKELEGLLAAAETKAAEASQLATQSEAMLAESDARIEELSQRAANLEGQVKSLEDSIKDASVREARSAGRVKELEEQVRAADERETKLEEQATERESRLKEETERGVKLEEQVRSLEDELRRLPQAASEVADIQAAMYSVMTKEADELRDMLELEKREADDFRKRHQERADRLLERRRELLKRAGANIEDMTRRALIERPEDPRTAQLRKELEDLRRLTERTNMLNEKKVQELEESLRIKDSELRRVSAQNQDVTQLQQEAQSLREKVQLREKELLEARQENETLRKNQALSQQALMTRLASLESPSIAPAREVATNQSREAHMVKLPGWMRLKK